MVQARAEVYFGGDSLDPLTRGQLLSILESGKALDATYTRDDGWDVVTILFEAELDAQDWRYSYGYAREEGESNVT